MSYRVTWDLPADLSNVVSLFVRRIPDDGLTRTDAQWCSHILTSTSATEVFRDDERPFSSSFVDNFNGSGDFYYAVYTANGAGQTAPCALIKITPQTTFTVVVLNDNTRGTLGAPAFDTGTTRNGKNVWNINIAAGAAVNLLELISPKVGWTLSEVYKTRDQSKLQGNAIRNLQPNEDIDALEIVYVLTTFTLKILDTEANKFATVAPTWGFTWTLPAQTNQSLVAVTNNCFVFSEWEGAPQNQQMDPNSAVTSILMDKSYVLTPRAIDGAFPVVVTENISGAAKTLRGTKTDVKCDTNHNISASASDDYVFKRWEVVQGEDNLTRFDKNESPQGGSAVIKITGPVIIQAVFAEKYTVRIETNEREWGNAVSGDNTTDIDDEFFIINADSELNTITLEAVATNIGLFLNWEVDNIGLLTGFSVSKGGAQTFFVNGDVTIKAIFATKYILDIILKIENDGICIADSSALPVALRDCGLATWEGFATVVGAGEYFSNNNVANFSISNIAPGYSFSRWSIDSPPWPDNIPVPTSESGGQVELDADAEIDVFIKLNQSFLTVTKNIDEAGTVTPNSARTTVRNVNSLSASDAPGYRFNRWEIVSGSGNIVTSYPTKGNTWTNPGLQTTSPSPQEIRISGDVEIQAIFDKVHTITLTYRGYGPSADSDSDPDRNTLVELHEDEQLVNFANYDGLEISLLPTQDAAQIQYTIASTDEPYVINGTEEGRFVFEGWEIIDEGTPSNNVNTALRTFSLSPVSDITLEAQIYQQYAVEVTTAVTDSGLTTGSGIYTVDRNGEITINLSATPAAGYEFDRWRVVSGSANIRSNIDLLDPNTQVLTIKRSNIQQGNIATDGSPLWGDVSIQAIMLKVNTLTLSVDRFHMGSTYQSGDGTYRMTEDVEVGTDTTNLKGYRFKEWQIISGATVAPIVPTSRIQTIKIKEDTELRAIYEYIRYTLDIDVLKDPNDNFTGSVTYTRTDEDGVNLSDSVDDLTDDTITVDHSITLTAVPETGFTFLRWSHESGEIPDGFDVNTATNSFQMEDDFGVKAEFVREYSLTIGMTIDEVDFTLSNDPNIGSIRQGKLKLTDPAQWDGRNLNIPDADWALHTVWSAPITTGEQTKTYNLALEDELNRNFVLEAELGMNSPIIGIETNPTNNQYKFIKFVQIGDDPFIGIVRNPSNPDLTTMTSWNIGADNLDDVNENDAVKEQIFLAFGRDLPTTDLTIYALYERLNALTLLSNNNAWGSAVDLTDDAPYEDGVDIVIQAEAELGFRFVEWEIVSGAGDVTGIVAGETLNVKTIQITGDVTLRAVFAFIEYNLVVQSEDDNEGTAVDVTNTGPYNATEIISIRATAKAGHRFIGWSTAGGPVIDLDADVASQTIKIAGNTVLTARFEKLYTLTLQQDPNAGSALSGAGTYGESESNGIAISASEPTGWRFVEWEIVGTPDTGTSVASLTSKATTVTLRGNLTLTAKFLQIIELSVETNIPTLTDATVEASTDSGQSGTLIKVTEADDVTIDTDFNADILEAGYYFDFWKKTNNTHTLGLGDNNKRNRKVRNIKVKRTTKLTAMYSPLKVNIITRHLKGGTSSVFKTTTKKFNLADGMPGEFPWVLQSAPAGYNQPGTTQQGVAYIPLTAIWPTVSVFSPTHATEFKNKSGSKYDAWIPDGFDITLDLVYPQKKHLITFEIIGPAGGETYLNGTKLANTVTKKTIEVLHGDDVTFKGIAGFGKEASWKIKETGSTKFLDLLETPAGDPDTRNLNGVSTPYTVILEYAVSLRSHIPINDVADGMYGTLFALDHDGDTVVATGFETKSSSTRYTWSKGTTRHMIEGKVPSFTSNIKQGILYYYKLNSKEVSSADSKRSGFVGLTTKGKYSGWLITPNTTRVNTRTSSGTMLTLINMFGIQPRTTNPARVFSTSYPRLVPQEISVSSDGTRFSYCTSLDYAYIPNDSISIINSGNKYGEAFTWKSGDRSVLDKLNIRRSGSEDYYGKEAGDTERSSGFKGGVRGTGREPLSQSRIDDGPIQLLFSTAENANTGYGYGLSLPSGETKDTFGYHAIQRKVGSTEILAVGGNKKIYIYKKSGNSWGTPIKTFTTGVEKQGKPQGVIIGEDDHGYYSTGYWFMPFDLIAMGNKFRIAMRTRNDPDVKKLDPNPTSTTKKFPNYDAIKIYDSTNGSTWNLYDSMYDARRPIVFYGDTIALSGDGNRIAIRTGRNSKKLSSYTYSSSGFRNSTFLVYNI